MSVSINDKVKGYKYACELEKSLIKLDIIADGYTVNRISDKRMSEVLFTIQYGLKDLGVDNLIDSSRYVYDNKEVDTLLKKYNIDKTNPREYTEEIKDRCYDEVFLKHFIEEASMKLAVRKMQFGDGAYNINDTYANDTAVVNSIELGACRASEVLDVVRCKSQIETLAYLAEDFAESSVNEEDAYKITDKIDKILENADMKPVNLQEVAIETEMSVNDLYTSKYAGYSEVIPATRYEPKEVIVDENLFERCRTEAFLNQYIEAAEDSLNDYIYSKLDMKIDTLETAYENAEKYYEAICKTGLEKAFECDIIKADDLGVKRFSENTMKYNPRQGTLRYKEKQKSSKLLQQER